MRFLIILLFTTWIQIGFGQVEQPLQYWTNYSVINPALSGLKKREFTDLGYKYSFKERGVGHSYFINSNYGIKRSSIGLSYQSSLYSNGNDGILQFNFAQHFLGDCRPGMTRYLNLGASIGIIHLTDTITSTSRIHPDVNFGFAYSKYGRIIGISFNHLLSSDPNLVDQYKPSVNVILNYGWLFGSKFRLNILGTTSMTRANLSGQIGLQFVKRRKYSVTLNYSSIHDVGLHYDLIIHRKKRYTGNFSFGLSAGYRLWEETARFWSGEVHVGFPFY